MKETSGRDGSALLSLSSDTLFPRVGRFLNFRASRIVIGKDSERVAVIGRIPAAEGGENGVEVIWPHEKSKVGKLSYELGHYVEELVMEQLKLWGLEPKLAPSDAPYDLTVGNCYIEVKTSFNGQEKVRKAFKRPHPEPFLVVLIDLKAGKTWIYESPQRRRKFTKRNLERVLRKLGVI